MGDESGKRSKTRTNKTGIRRTKPSVSMEQAAAGGDPMMTELLVPQSCSEPPRTYGAPGGVWSSQHLPYFRQVRWGVCFFCTSSRQRLRSSSQGSSKFLQEQLVSDPKWAGHLARSDTSTPQSHPLSPSTHCGVSLGKGRPKATTGR